MTCNGGRAGANVQKDFRPLQQVRAGVGAFPFMANFGEVGSVCWKTRQLIQNPRLVVQFLLSLSKAETYFLLWLVVHSEGEITCTGLLLLFVFVFFLQIQTFFFP